MKNSTNIRLLVLFILAIQFGCAKKQAEVQPKNIQQNADIVPVKEARKIAQNYNLNEAKIASVTTTKVDGVDAIYIINFEDNKGYVLVSAERRMSPVLAFNDKGSFTLENTQSPGIKAWFNDGKQAIAQLRKAGKPASNEVLGRWATSARLKRNARTTGLKYVPALTHTQWGQGCFYNAKAPLRNTPQCERAYTGCVATAVTQVLKYYYGDYWREGYQQAKNTTMGRSYNWLKMNNKLTENESSDLKGIALLMKDVGDDVRMYYTDNGSFSSAKYYAYPRFKDTYGFDATTLQFLAYSGNEATVSQKVTEELDQKHLSVFVGYNEDGAGHVWVCDGYYQYDNHELFFHMNWGWDGRPDNTNGTNGWYLYNSFKPGGRTFNNGVNVITGFRVDTSK